MRACATRRSPRRSYREEGELLNVWVALLNLENLHGQPREEAVARTFARAAARCDEKKLLLALAGIYARTEQRPAAAQALATACRKFSGSAKVWLRRISLDLEAGNGDGARATVERAVKALPARKHVKLLTRTALLEFRCGSAERGRAIFEGVLANYPRRLDLWSVYMDQEIKLGGDLVRPTLPCSQGRGGLLPSACRWACRAVWLVAGLFELRCCRLFAGAHPRAV